MMAELDKLEAALARARPEVVLRPGANAAALAKLPKGAPELVEWFGWHDGQRGTASLSPQDNRYLLSIDDALDAAKFLADEGEGWKPSWFPLFGNGAGDYVVIETARGKQRGALIAYWHADADRPVEHASLAAWVTATTRALAELPAAAAKPAPDRGPVQLALARDFAKVAMPKKAAFASAPVGTMYRCTHLPAVVRAQPQLHVYCKLAPKQWVRTVLAIDADPVAGLAARLGDPARVWTSDDGKTPDLLKQSANRGDLAVALVTISA